MLGSALINRWFRGKARLALGILGAAFSSGQLIFTPWVMQINTDFGWAASAADFGGAVGDTRVAACSDSTP